MEELIEQYGTGILQIAGGIVAMILMVGVVKQGGTLWQICLQYIDEICGIL